MIAKTKKAQAQIIVTVLIILIVLGIIGFIATMVTRTVREGTEEAGGIADCLSLDVKILEAIEGDALVSVERGVGGSNVDLTNIRVYVEGAWVANVTTVPAELETASATVNALNATEEIKIAPVIGDSLCDFSDTRTVAAGA